MSKESLVILLGILVFFAPTLGIPDNWKYYIFLGSGFLLMLIGYLLRRAAYLRSIDRGNGESGTDAFVESSKKTEEISDEVSA